MGLHRLTRIALGVPEVQEACAFYRDFGLEEIAPGRFATADGGEQLRIQPAPERVLRELGVGVHDPDDLDRIAENLARLGIACVGREGALETQDPGTGISVVVAIAEPIAHKATPAAAFNRPGRTERRNARADAISRAEPPRPRKLGHVALASADGAASRRFFLEGLGFRQSDAFPGGAFLRCSSDHHNVAVQDAPVSFLHHTSWQLADVDEIGQAATRVLAGHPERHLWGLGRHAIGSNFFWYLRDPAGNYAEYYSDMDVIVDDAAWQPGSFSGQEILYSWAPKLPDEFLAPRDVVRRAGSTRNPSDERKQGKDPT